MIPSHNTISHPASRPPQATVLAPGEAPVQSIKREEVEKDLFSFVSPPTVNDPSQWDESWFASYE
jgi:hypothetical protein